MASVADKTFFPMISCMEVLQATSGCMSFEADSEQCVEICCDCSLIEDWIGSWRESNDFTLCSQKSLILSLNACKIFLLCERQRVLKNKSFQLTVEGEYSSRGVDFGPFWSSVSCLISARKVLLISISLEFSAFNRRTSSLRRLAFFCTLQKYCFIETYISPNAYMGWLDANVF